LTKKPKTYIWRPTHTYSLNKEFWENWISTGRRLKVVSCLSFYMKINSRWIKDLMLRLQTLNAPQEKHLKISKGSYFLPITPIAKKRRGRIHK
jgi:hypothetical protein